MFPIFDNKGATSLVCIFGIYAKASAILAVALFSLNLLTFASANENDRTPLNPISQAVFPNDPGYLLISYSLMQESLAVNDEVPLLRIYGDGRVHVHRPEYLKKSGDYQMHLTAGELQTLCMRMMQKNIMAYRDRAVALDIEAEKRRSEVSHHVSDDVHSSIELNLHGVKLGGRDKMEAVGKRKHRVTNVRAKAQFYPNIRSIADLAEIESLLNQFIYDPRLRAIQ